MEKVLADIINSLPWSTMGGFFVAAIIFAIAKRYYDNLSAYWMFRSNGDLGKNVRVVIDGQEGFIVHVSWRFIYIKIKSSGNELIIPMSKWNTFRWEIYKNGN